MRLSGQLNAIGLVFQPERFSARTDTCRKTVSGDRGRKVTLLACSGCRNKVPQAGDRNICAICHDSVSEVEIKVSAGRFLLRRLSLACEGLWSWKSCVSVSHYPLSVILLDQGSPRGLHLNRITPLDPLSPIIVTFWNMGGGRAESGLELQCLNLRQHSGPQTASIYKPKRGMWQLPLL